MTLPVVLLVLLAALMHAAWNALVKSGEDQLVTQTLVIGTGSVMGAVLATQLPLPAPAAWPFLLLSAVAHGGYHYFLIRSYQSGDLSRVYPLARGSAPLLVAAVAVGVAEEGLGPGQVLGVVLVSAGVVSLATVERPDRALFDALMTGAFIAFYSVCDGLGVRHSGHAVSYIAWLFVLAGIPLMVASVLLRRRRLAQALRAHRWRGLFGGLNATVGYGIVVWAMSHSGLTQVVSLRVTSVIFAALIGTILLGESGWARKTVAALLVAAGNLLLQLAPSFAR